MSLSHLTMLLAGCGNMGSALVEGWLRGGLPNEQLSIIDPKASQLARRYNCNAATGLDGLPDDYSPDIILFAVKPVLLAELLPGYGKRFGARPIYASVAAGKPLAFYEQHLGLSPAPAVVRIMPNTPAFVGKSMTACFGNTSLSDEGNAAVTQLMNAVGRTVWLREESQMDAVTAISGSGPAYVFHFMECLQHAGKALGLSDEMSRILTLNTVHGASLLALLSEHDLSTLRRNVTSPGGTTEAALSAFLEGDALMELVKEATRRARDKSLEMQQ